MQSGTIPNRWGNSTREALRKRAVQPRFSIYLGRPMKTKMSLFAHTLANLHNHPNLHIDRTTPKWLIALAFGLMAEWLRSGLQSRVRRFDSGSGLHTPPYILRKPWFHAPAVRCTGLAERVCLPQSQCYRSNFWATKNPRQGAGLRLGP